MASQDPRTSAFPNTGARDGFPRVDTLRRNAPVGALIEKLVSPQPGTAGTASTFTNRSIDLPNSSLMRKISDITATNVNDASSLMQLLPDTELAIQILVAVVLSPKDMMTVELVYSSNMETADAELSQALLSVLRKHFETSYKIKPLLPRILEDLFTVGSYPLIVLPENVIDATINSADTVRVTTESATFQSLFDPRTGRLHDLGVLGLPADRTARTSFTMESITNPNTLKAGEAFKYDPTVAVSMENYNKLFEFKPTERLKQEEIDAVKGKFKLEKSFVTAIDNIHILKMPMLIDAMRAEKLQKAYHSGSMSMEARRPKKPGDEKKISVNEVQRALYRPRTYRYMPVVTLTPVDSRDRPTVGNPLVMKVPAESVIPVHVPGNPEQHIGYFVMIDVNGNPVSRTAYQDYYTDLANNLNGNQEMVSQLIATTKRMELGRDFSREQEEDEIVRVYSELIEQDLLNRLRNGLYGDHVELSRPQEVYRVMLSRALAQKHTQLLYVPAEFMTYFAFDYNKYGVGLSLLQKNKIVGGMRAMLLFANTMASIKNSIQRMVINITLDPKDPQPTNTVEFLLHEVAKTRQATYPLGASNPVDLVTYLQSAGVEVVVQGNTRYPETKLELESKQSSYAKPDTELEESMRKRFLAGMGLTPEMVDSSSSADFATTLVQQNILLAKRAMNYQELLMAQVVEFIQKYVVNSSQIMDELIDILESNLDKIPDEYKAAMDGEGRPLEGKEDDGSSPGMRYLTMFLRTLDISLPAPDTARQKSQKEAFDEYVQFLDAALDAYLDPDSFDSSLMSEYSQIMPAIRKTVRSYFLRQYLRVNGMLPELDDLVTKDDDDRIKLNLLDMEQGHVEALMASIGDYAKELIEYQKKHPMPQAEAEEPATGAEGDLTGGDGTDLGGEDGAIPGDGTDTDVTGEEEPGTTEETPDETSEETPENPDESGNPPEETPDSTETTPDEEEEEEEEDTSKDDNDTDKSS